MNWFLLIASDGNIGPFYTDQATAMRMRRALPSTSVGNYSVGAPMFLLNPATNQWVDAVQFATGVPLTPPGL